MGLADITVKIHRGNVLCARWVPGPWQTWSAWPSILAFTANDAETAGYVS